MGRSASFVAIVILYACLVSGAAGHTLNWDPASATPGVQGGDGAWNLSPANPAWFDGSGANVSWPNGAAATFGGAGGTVTVDVGGVAASSLTFDLTVPHNPFAFEPPHKLTGGPLTLTAATITAHADARIDSPIYGAAGLTKAGGGKLTLGAANPFSGDVTIAGGTLAVSADAALGSTAVPQEIRLAGGTLLFQPPSVFPGPSGDTLSANRRIVVGSGDGGTLRAADGDARGPGRPWRAALVLPTPGQLSGAGRLTVSGGVADFDWPRGGVDVAAANDGLTGPVRVDGLLVASATGALGRGTVDVGPRGILNLRAPAAVGASVAVNGGRLEYDAAGALGGRAARVSTGVAAVGSNVTATAGDRFDVGAGAAVVVPYGARAGLLRRGQDLSLAPGAIVDIDTRGDASGWSIADLGAANDLWKGSVNLDPYASAYDGSVTVGQVRVGVTGPTPFKGITARNSVVTAFDFRDTRSIPVIGDVEAVGDFLIDGISFGGRAWAPAGGPARRAVAGTDVTLFGARFENVTVDVPTGSGVLIKSGLDAAGLGLGAGTTVYGRAFGSPTFEMPMSVSLGTLTGSGTLAVGAYQGRVTVGVGDATSRFDGELRAGTVEKVGAGTFTVAGMLATTNVGANDAPLVVVSGGTLALSVPVSPMTVSVASGATLELAAGDQTIGSLTGTGRLRLGGGSVSLAGGQFDGIIEGGGSLNLGDVSYTGLGTITGPVAVDGRASVRADRGLPNASSVTLRPGGRLTLDFTATPAGFTTGAALAPTAPVELSGGTLVVAGADGRAVTQPLGPVLPNAGASTIEVAAGAGGTATVASASLGPRDRGATVNFAGVSAAGAPNRLTFAAGPGGAPLPAGFVAAWAIANRADFAAYDPAVGVVPFAGYTTDLGAAGHLLVAASNASLPNNFSARTLKVDASAGPVHLVQAFTTLTLNDGGLLKVGAHPASVTGGSGTVSGGALGELVVFTEGGDLTIGSRIAGGALTKSGGGKLILAGPTANTFAGPTYVNEGTLELAKGVPAGAVPAGDVFVNGGTVRLAAGDQIHDAATVTVNAGGTFGLGGFQEKVAAVVVNGGGRFEVGGAAPAPAAPLPLPTVGARSPQGAPPVPADAPRAADVGAIVVSGDGQTLVRPSALLYVGTGGLTFRGGKTPRIVIDAGGVLDLHGDVSVNDANTRAEISGAGDIDLNGARIFTPDPQTRLAISARVGEGRFEKKGQGTLDLSGNFAFTGTLAATGGVVDVREGNAAARTRLELDGGHLKYTLPIPTGTRIAYASAAATVVRSDATLTVDERLLPTPPGEAAPVRTPGTLSVSGDLEVERALTLTFETATDTRLHLPGGVRLDADITVVAATPVTLSGRVTGDGALTKSGAAATLALGGGDANDFGPLSSAVGPAGQRLYAATVNAGTLELRKASNVTAVRGNMKIASGGTVRLFAPGQIADDAAVDLAGSGARLDLNGFDETIGSLSVGGGSEVVTGGATLTAGTIQLLNGGRVRVGARPAAAAAPPSEPGRAGFGGAVLQVRALSATGAASSIDLQNNALIVNYDPSSPSPIASVRDMVRDPAAALRIVSSPAAADPAAAVGYAEAADVLRLAAGQAGTFLGRGVDASAVLVRYTLAGDADLDGRVDFADLVRLAQNYNTDVSAATASWWARGDVTYDGRVDFNDLVKLAQNYNAALPAAAAATVPAASAEFQGDLVYAFAAVPEPSATFVAFAAGAWVFSARRPRRRPAVPHREGRVMLEGLENRCLLSSSLNAATGELLVTGTAGNDTLRLATAGQLVVVSDNGRAASFDAGKVKRVRVVGLDGNDTVSLLPFAPGQSELAVVALLDGGNGNDTLTGGAAGDTLNGGNGNDALDGRGGNDLLDGGLGADVVAGGAGVDTLSYASRSAALYVTMDDDAANDGQANERDNVRGDVENLLGGAGRDVLIGNPLANTIDGGAGADTLSGRAGNDSLLGGAGDGNDQLFGKEGDDTLRGGSGNDSLVGDAGDDSLDAGIGNDTVTGDAGADRLWGNEGFDRLAGGDGDDAVDGGIGHDTVAGGAGDDTLRGGAGNDVYAGGDGADTVDYSDHDSARPVPNRVLEVFVNDQADDGFYVDGLQVEFDRVGTDVEALIGTSGDDYLFVDELQTAARVDGRGGNDLISGTPFADTLVGGNGNDTVRGNGGDDAIDGSAGPTAAPGAPTDDDALNGGAGDDSIAGGRGDDVVNGGAGADTLDGGTGADNLDGDLGNDSLLGGDGDDTLTGGQGDNTFRGGAGADLMTGNNGADLFADLAPGQAPAPDPTGGEEDGSFLAAGGDSVFAGSGNDTIVGNAAGDALYGEDGDDSIAGGDGRDLVDGGDGNDTLDGQADNDTVVGGFNDDQVRGGDGNDVLGNSDGEADVVDGGDGFDAAQEEAALNDLFADVEYFYDLNGDADTDPPAPAPAPPGAVVFEPPPVAAAGPGGPSIDLSANGRTVAVRGTAGADTVTAAALAAGRLRVTVVSPGGVTESRDLAATVRNLIVLAGSGNDVIDVTAAPPAVGTILDGGGGNDTIRGGPGADDVIGGPGPTATETDDDVLSGGTGPNPGLEADTLDYADRRRGVFVFLPSTASEATTGNGQARESDRVLAGFEQVFGGRSDDRLLGGARPDFLSGGRGGDFMEGGRGDDVIIGYVARETGVDTLIGGRGKDSLRSKDDGFTDEYEADPADFRPQIDRGLDVVFVPR